MHMLCVMVSLIVLPYVYLMYLVAISCIYIYIHWCYATFETFDLSCSNQVCNLFYSYSVIFVVLLHRTLNTLFTALVYLLCYMICVTRIRKFTFE